VVVGQLGVVIPDVLSTTFFLLFLFSVGYKTGPQFFGGFGRNTLVQLILTLFFGVTGLMMAYGLAHFLRFNAGTAVGLLGGGFDSTEALGTGNDAIGKLAVAESIHRTLMADAAVAFAVTDIVGVLTGVVLLARVAPWMMRVNLVEECRKLEEELGMETEEPGVVSAYRPISVRSYTLPESMDNETVCDLEHSFLPERVFVERVKNAQGTIDADANLRLHAGDLIVLSGRRSTLGGSSNPLHRCETQEPELLDIPMIEVDYVVERKDLAHRTLGQIVDALGGGSTRGVFVTKLLRAGKELPFGSKVVLERGDVLTFIGAKHHVDRVAEQLGSVERPSNATDIVSLCVTLVIGGLIGFPVLHLSKINLGLGLPVGVLLASFVIGWLHSVKPGFGRLPGPVDWLLDSLGLTAFVAAIGINAGPSFVQGVRTDGLVLLITGVVVCAVPYVLTVLVGR
jgi:putative transport protein